MNKTNRNRLDALYLEYSRNRWPNCPEHARPGLTVKDSTTNGLTQCVITFLQISGWQAERVANTGRYMDSSKVVTDVAGFKRKIGSGKFIPGTGTKGTSDIHSVIFGRAVKLEIKFGRDVQSQAQKNYQKSIESAGGFYWVIKTFDQFLEVYDEFLVSL